MVVMQKGPKNPLEKHKETPKCKNISEREGENHIMTQSKLKSSPNPLGCRDISIVEDSHSEGVNWACVTQRKCKGKHYEKSNKLVCKVRKSCVMTTQMRKMTPVFQKIHNEKSKNKNQCKRQRNYTDMRKA